MTIKAFWDDPYRLRQEARVSSALGDEVRVDETIFFAFSGARKATPGPSVAIRCWKHAGMDWTSPIDCPRGTVCG
ncbi:hypothetical protein [Stenotrophomonas maltophilia]|uniref:hypothetical protein n=1 Tax=Stenotrophomonas maltophilia TaxID=40324 RepID=UPI001C8F7D90|nr:hypothetical protein [Stenotrophomonas maltophilia]